MEEIINKNQLINLEINSLFYGNIVTDLEEIEKKITKNIFDNPLKDIEKCALFKIRFN